MNMILYSEMKVDQYEVKLFNSKLYIKKEDKSDEKK